MRNEPREMAGSPTGVWLVAAVVVAFFTLSPQASDAHSGEKHGADELEAVAGTAVEPVEHERASHEHSEVHPDAVETPSGHPYPPEGVPRPLAWLGKFHPLATHFPIALLSIAAISELLLLRKPSELFRQSVRFCVWTGAIGALAAAPLGWFFAGFHIVDDEWLMTAHRWTGTAAAVWALAILYLCERTYRDGADRKRFRLALFLGAGLVGATGFLGGSLIYGLDHYAW